MQNTPFIHKFKTDDKYYIYDVNSNDVLCVNACIADIIDDTCVLDEQKLVEKYSSKYPKEEIQKSHNSIMEEISAGRHFLSNKINRVETPCDDKSEMIRLLNTGLESLNLCVTHKCNFRCNYCTYSENYPHNRNHGMGEMSWDIAKQAIDFFFKRTAATKYEDKKTRSLTFYGGEPFLNFDLIRQCVEYVDDRYFKKYPVIYSITTNGTLLNDEILSFLGKHGINLFISLDGYKENHDANRKYANGNGTHDDVVSAINRIDMFEKNNKVTIRHDINCVITGSSDLLKMNDFFAEFQTKSCHLGHVASIQGRHENLFDECYLMLDPESLGKCMALFVQKVLANEMTDEQGNVTPSTSFLRQLFVGPFLEFWRRNGHLRECQKRLPESLYPGKTCVVGMRKVHVDIDGTFYPCERTEEDYEYFRIGNVHQGFDYDKCWRIMEEYVLSTEKECTDCWAVRICPTTCIVQTCEQNAFSRAKKLRACEEGKSTLTEYLVVMYKILEKNPDAFTFLNQYSNPLFDDDSVKRWEKSMTERIKT